MFLQKRLFLALAFKEQSTNAARSSRFHPVPLGLLQSEWANPANWLVFVFDKRSGKP